MDVYTWALLDTKPEHYFTSFLNASLVDLRDDSVDEFVAWQKQVCCGDDEYLQYKLRIFGLSLTTMNFDRCFYMPLGPVGKNGKSSEATLFNEVTQSITPNRGYTISREYLTKTSQDRKGANAADTVLMEMVGKCIVIADEMRDAPLDDALLKAFVSGDKTSARNLYESERTGMSFKFTLWVIANKTLKIDYTDTALMSRLRVLPYNAQWVAHPAAVKSKMSMPQSLFVFKEDPYFKDKTLRGWGDALVTKSLYELHLFFKSLPADPHAPDRPLKLVAFPVPAVVRNFTDATIQRMNPVQAFVHKYMVHAAGETMDIDAVFQQFRQFGRNENNFKITRMNRSFFQEALVKEGVEFKDDADNRPVIFGHVMRGDVPVLDRRVDVPASFQQPPPTGNVVDGVYDYQPPAVKRKRDDDDDRAYADDLDGF